MKHYILTTKAIGLSRCGGRKPQTLHTAARHNLREIQAENGADYGKIDPTRMALNQVLIGPTTAKEVQAELMAQYKNIGKDPCKLRRDHNQGHETMISLESDQDAELFFKVIANHANYIFGKGVVLSFVVHNDQTLPHCHVLTSPIEGGQLCGSKRTKVKSLKSIKERVQEVAKTIGFAPRARMTKCNLSAKAAAVVAQMEKINHPLLHDSTFAIFMQMIQKDPTPLFNHFGLTENFTPQTVSEKRLFKGSCKSSKPRHKKETAQETQSLSCVGIEQRHPTQSEQISAAQPHDEQEYQGKEAA
jgi:hypothetical protein